MSAGKVWQRPDGQLWVEVQVAAMEPSGWRIVVPLVEAGQAPDAAPLVVAAGRWRARTHLIVGVPTERLGEAVGELAAGQIAAIREALLTLVTEAVPPTT